MRNKEKYRRKIIEIAMKGDILAVNKDTKQPMRCSISNCIYCLFEDSFGCFEERNKWLNQKVEILDETEKAYLRSVIKPFIEHVTYIRKSSLGSSAQYVSIVYTELRDFMPGGYIGEIMLPCFANDTMYKGMEIGYKYTVKELGL